MAVLGFFFVVPSVKERLQNSIYPMVYYIFDAVFVTTLPTLVQTKVINSMRYFKSYRMMLGVLSRK